VNKAFLLRKKAQTVCLFCLIFLYYANASVESAKSLTSNNIITKSGNISQDEIWYAGWTYYVVDNIVLKNDAVLKIEPGTIIKFENNKSINAQKGRLIAKGSPYEYIVFTSKYDPNMGDAIDSNQLPTRGQWRGLYISEDDTISFCKIGYANCAVDIVWDYQPEGTIENNIIYNSAYAAIGGIMKADAEGTYSIKNNLIFNKAVSTFGIYFTCSNIPNGNVTIANNTIVKNDTGVYCGRIPGGSGEFSIFNNLIVDCPSKSIWLENLNYEILNNGFFNAAAQGANSVVCSSTPFDIDTSSLGSFFLNKNSNGGTLLTDAGAGEVKECYENPRAWSIYNVPNDSNHLFNSQTIFTEDKIWLPNYSTCDTHRAAIGYHHPRIDYCLNENVFVTPGKKLEIKPDTIISINKIFGLSGSAIKCTTEVNNKIYFLNRQSASENWLKPSQSNSFSSSYPGEFQFIDFSALSSCNLPNASAIKDCVFKFLTAGLNTENAVVLNNIFSECQIAINLANNIDLKSNTFDRCQTACSINTDGGNNCTLTNNLFMCNTYAINENDSEAYNFIENYNAFLANDYDGVSLGANSFSLSDESELYQDWEIFSDRFYLSEYSALINAGNPVDAAMLGYTCDPLEHAIDDDVRDIGFHYPVQNEYWLCASSPDYGNGSQSNPFNSISQVEENSDYNWDIIHIVTVSESDSNLAKIFDVTGWPEKQYLTSAVYRNGIRWDFDYESRIGQFCNGDFWVLTPVEINSVSPLPQGSGYNFRNGSMLNPTGGTYQSYDGRADGFTSYLSLQYPLVIDGLNSLISTASITDQSRTCTYGYYDVSNYCVRYNYLGDFHSYLYNAAVLTSVPYKPPENVFRPPYSGHDKPYISKTSLQTDLLPALPLSTKPSVTYLNLVAKEFHNVWLDQTGRLIHPIRNMPNYGREIGTAVSEASCLLMLDYSQSQLDPLVVDFVQTGIDLYYLCKSGKNWIGDGGHDNGRKLPIVFAGLMLNNDSMKNIVQYQPKLGCEDMQTYYNSQNKALWGRNCVSSYTLACDGNGPKDCRDPNQMIDGCISYRNCCTSGTWVGQAVSLKILGLESIWSHDAFFDYVHRWVTADVSGGGEISGGSYIRDMWNIFWPYGVTIIDNGQTGSTSSTGTWRNLSAATPYSTTALWAYYAGTYTWIFKPLETGRYKVSLWWTADLARGTSIPLAIQHSFGTAQTNINQSENGGQWNDIGEYTMSAGDSYQVKITAPDGNTATACADAVKFTYMSAANAPPTASIISISPSPALLGQTVYFVGSASDSDGTITAYKWQSNIDGDLSDEASFNTSSLSEGTHLITFTAKDNSDNWSLPVTQYLTVGQSATDVIIDNGDSRTSSTGTWAVSSAPNPYGVNSLWSYSGATYTWSFTPAQSAIYKVSMWWTQLTTRSSSVPVKITYGGQTTTVRINQQQNGGQWNELGEYSMDANSICKVTITAPSGSPPSTCADAVRFETITLDEYNTNSQNSFPNWWFWHWHKKTR
jgi:hypothetical protein